MEIKGKIGIGIVTYKRPAMLMQLLETIPIMEGYGKGIHHIVVVNDGPEYGLTYDTRTDFEYIQNEENVGVGISKNIAINALINFDCTHLFILEDDILIKDPAVFEYFIECASESGIWHLNYGHTGEKKIIHRKKYDNTELIFYPDPQGGFQYFHKNLITNCGGFDPGYKNAFEHADYTYRLTKRGLMPPFWCFPCPAGIGNYLEINEDFEESTITDKPMYRENYNAAAQHWIKKHGSFVSAIPRPSITDVEKCLEDIKQKYGVEN